MEIDLEDMSDREELILMLDVFSVKLELMLERLFERIEDLEERVKDD